MGKSSARRDWKGEEEGTHGGGKSRNKGHEAAEYKGAFLEHGLIALEHGTHTVGNKTEQEVRAQRWRL